MGSEVFVVSCCSSTPLLDTGGSRQGTQLHRVPTAPRLASLAAYALHAAACRSGAVTGWYGLFRSKQKPPSECNFKGRFSVLVCSFVIDFVVAD